MYAPSPRWNLEVLLSGGVGGDAFEAGLTACAAELDALRAARAQLDAIAAQPDAWRAWLVAYHALQERLGDLEALAHCHHSAHTDDTVGRLALGRADELGQRLHQEQVAVEAALGACTDDALDALCTGELVSWRRAYARARDAQRMRLEPPLQALLSEADREGLHAWGQLYDLVTGTLTAPFEQDGVTAPVGIARLAALRAHPDADVRRRAFLARNQAFESVADLCATALTHLTGARQMRLDRVGGGELDETLFSNRIDQDVLDAMWAGADQLRPTLTRYLALKARALGRDALDFWDVDAPLGRPPGGDALDWDGAQALVVDAFEPVEPELAAFSRALLQAGGVEAEARDHKRPGGYCCGFSGRATSRIFMTFTGSVDNAVTLAHELGHAWHNHLLFQAPRGERQLTNGLAESASTFAESLVRHEILARASDPTVRLFMLDQQLQAGVSFLMNIRARFAFERALYRLRRAGPLSADALTAEMLAAQREAYAGALGSWDPMFWASKLHFYISHFGFYNWPYTFGYLFSGAIAARARAEGPAFRPVVKELLLRTGWQDCAPLARDLLGADLRDPSFWAGAAAPLVDQLAEFERALARAEPR